MKEFDLIVIGAGPGGEKAAVKAAYFGYKVAIIEKEDRPGGAGINTGTLPSKTLKETAVYFSGINDKGLYGVDRRLERGTSVNDFLYRKNFVTETESLSVNNNLLRHRVETFRGKGKLIDPNTVKVCGRKEETIRGEHIIIATGSHPFHPDEIPFDYKRVHDSDSILGIQKFPDSICIAGAGVIGCEYATIFATMGVDVFLVNRGDTVLPFLDQEIAGELIRQMRAGGVEILFNTSVEAIRVPTEPEDPIEIPLDSGVQLNVDMYLFAAGRKGNTDDLGCEEVGVEVDARGAIKVDKTYKTSVPNIYAIGDCVGFPALASTSMDQGRVAVANIFNIGDVNHLPSVYPFGVYTIPEVSCVGMTEEQAKQDGIDYCIGLSYYKNMPRGKILGAKEGFMKIIFNRNDLTILGVHLIGTSATELVHYGVTLVENKKTLKEVIATIFNFPTLHDLYKYACYDGLTNVTGHKVH